MKKSHATLCLSFFSLNLFCQNWAVFNKNYRYNYQHDNSNVISNVIFQDSLKAQNGDTIFYLNTVAIECSGACPGYSVVFTPTNPAVITNMPQFLQRQLVKYANGDIFLRDPFKMVIKPNCLVNQTWLFDSIANFQATCTAIVTQTVFGVTDSVKVIVVNVGDTMRLSKNFGIIKFPEIYGKNKSYYLVGIENKNSFDPTALFGQKVPNAWDIYNYEVGDIMCSSYTDRWGVSGRAQCLRSQMSITSKTITATGYLYEVESYMSYDNQSAVTGGGANCFKEMNKTITTVSYTNLSSSSLIENRMYPGAVVKGLGGYLDNVIDGFSPVAKKNLDNVSLLKKGPFGVLYKTMGKYKCQQPIGVPSGLINSFVLNYATIGPLPVVPSGFVISFSESAITFAEGMGMMTWGAKGFEFSGQLCKTCFVRNNKVLFGNVYVGLPHLGFDSAQPDIRVWPNPVGDVLTVEFMDTGRRTQDGIMKISNSLGQVIRLEDLSQKSKEGSGSFNFDIRDLPVGIYFLSLDTGQGILTKKIVKE